MALTAVLAGLNITAALGQAVTGIKDGLELYRQACKSVADRRRSARGVEMRSEPVSQQQLYSLAALEAIGEAIPRSASVQTFVQASQAHAITRLPAVDASLCGLRDDLVIAKPVAVPSAFSLAPLFVDAHYCMCSQCHTLQTEMLARSSGLNIAIGQAFGCEQLVLLAGEAFGVAMVIAGSVASCLLGNGLATEDSVLEAYGAWRGLGTTADIRLCAGKVIYPSPGERLSTSEAKDWLAGLGMGTPVADSPWVWFLNPYLTEGRLVAVPRVSVFMQLSCGAEYVPSNLNVRRNGYINRTGISVTDLLFGVEDMAGCVVPIRVGGGTQAPILALTRFTTGWYGLQDSTPDVGVHSASRTVSDLEMSSAVALHTSQLAAAALCGPILRVASLVSANWSPIYGHLAAVLQLTEYEKVRSGLLLLVKHIIRMRANGGPVNPEAHGVAAIFQDLVSSARCDCIRCCGMAATIDKNDCMWDDADTTAALKAAIQGVVTPRKNGGIWFGTSMNPSIGMSEVALQGLWLAVYTSAVVALARPIIGIVRDMLACTPGSQDMQGAGAWYGQYLLALQASQSELMSRLIRTDGWMPGVLRLVATVGSVGGLSSCLRFLSGVDKLTDSWVCSESAWELRAGIAMGGGMVWPTSGLAFTIGLQPAGCSLIIPGTHVGSAATAPGWVECGHNRLGSLAYPIVPSSEPHPNPITCVEGGIGDSQVAGGGIDSKEPAHSRAHDSGYGRHLLRGVLRWQNDATEGSHGSGSAEIGIYGYLIPRTAGAYAAYAGLLPIYPEVANWATPTRVAGEAGTVLVYTSEIPLDLRFTKANCTLATIAQGPVASDGWVVLTPTCQCQQNVLPIDTFRRSRRRPRDVARAWPGVGASWLRTAKLERLQPVADLLNAAPCNTDGIDSSAVLGGHYPYIMAFGSEGLPHSMDLYLLSAHGTGAAGAALASLLTTGMPLLISWPQGTPGTGVEGSAVDLGSLVRQLGKRIAVLDSLGGSEESEQASGKIRLGAAHEAV
ncbi:hypothetical protein GQ54DRAFT_300572 [Martensiomyces pterosporus]|nr:hypothetical protein GQ54DRAFT_300572 [Martensiomyces pterosporus]